MNLQKLLDMKIGEAYKFASGYMVRVPGGWVYQIAINGVAIALAFIPEPKKED